MGRRHLGGGQSGGGDGGGRLGGFHGGRGRGFARRVVGCLGFGNRFGGGCLGGVRPFAGLFGGLIGFPIDVLRRGDGIQLGQGLAGLGRGGCLVHLGVAEAVQCVLHGPCRAGRRRARGIRRIEGGLGVLRPGVGDGGVGFGGRLRGQSVVGFGQGRGLQ